MIITLAGLKGSGKSALGRALSASLGYEYFYMGALFRKAAEDRGMTIAEYDVYVRDHPQIDRDMDRKVFPGLRRRDDIVVDANIGAYFLPNAYRVFLTAPIDVRAHRVAQSPRAAEAKLSIAQARKELAERDRIVINRLERLYGFRIDDHANYDLVLDTSKLTIEGEIETIRKGMRSQL